MGESSTPKLFSEEERRMISEYHRFVEERGRDVRKKWVEFRSFSSYTQKYEKRNIAEKMRRLETRFLKMNISSLPEDPLQSHVFQLCRFLWGKPNQSSTHLPSNLSSQLRELALFCENKSLRLKDSQFEYDKLQPQYQSQSSKKRKVSGQLLAPTALHYGVIQDNADSSKEDTADLSIDCSQVKSGNVQPFGGAEKDVVDDEAEKTLPTNDVVIKEDLVVGNTNKKIATKGATVKVHFTGKVKGSDEAFESSLDKDPYIICLGSKELIEGLSNGIEGMRVDGKRRLTIPPSLGFGEEGCGEIVPPNSWLEYEVELVGVKY